MVAMIMDNQDRWAVNKRTKKKRLKFYTPATTLSSMSLTKLHERQISGAIVETANAKTLPNSFIFDSAAQDSSLGSLAPSSTITFLTTMTSDSARASPAVVPTIASTLPSKSSVPH